MKINPKTKVLLDACEAAAPAVAQRTTMPVLQCLKLTAADDALTVHATDRELGLTLRIDGVQTIREGSVCVSADSLTKLLKKIDGDDLFLSSPGFDGEPTCEVTSGLDLFRLPTENADTFPAFDAPAGETATWEVDGLEFARMLRRAKFAVGKDSDSRFTIGGLYAELEGDKLALFCTDTKILTIVTGRATGDGQWSGMVPMKAVHLIEKLAIGPARLIASRNALQFQCGGAALTTRLVVGRYPPYRSIIPTKIERKAGIKSADLLRAAQKVRLMCDEQLRSDVTLSAGKLSFAVETKKGVAKTAVCGVDYDGDDFSIGIDPEYLIELAKAVESDSLVVQFAGLAKPVMFTAGDDWTCLVFPMGG